MANPFDLYRDQFSVQIVREKFKSFVSLEKDHWLTMNGGFEDFEKNGGASALIILLGNIREE